MLKHVSGKLERDKQVVEALVRRHGPISQAHIFELTHIRRSTTSRVVRELIEEGRVEKAGLLRAGAGAGRKQVLLRLKEDYRYVVAIEFDEETVQAGVLDLHPRMLHTVTEATDLSGGVDGLVRQLVSCARQAIRKAGVAPDMLLGIAVADPGLVDSRRGVCVFSSTIDFWRDVPLRTILESEFGLPVLVESKTRARTVAERLLGAGQGAASIIYIDYGIGIGAGVVIEGRLLLGESGAAGEFGHTHMADGPACNCGSFGCLEAVAGARAVEAKVRQAIADGGYTLALEMAHGDPAAITAWDVLRASHQGDKISSHLTAEIANYLGFGLANLVNLFNPAVVVLDRRLELAGPDLLNQIVAAVRRQALTYSASDAAFRFAALGPEAGLLGAALLTLEQHFEIPMLKPPRFMIEPVPAPETADREEALAEARR